MDSAHIWFRQQRPVITLAHAGDLFREAGLTVERAEWRLYDDVIPQLLVKTHIPFLIQIDDDAIVAEEAVEVSEWHEGEFPDAMLSKLKRSNTRFDVGAPEERVQIVDGPLVFLDAYEINPSKPEIWSLLQLLARAVDGVLYDNVNGNYWAP